METCAGLGGMIKVLTMFQNKKIYPQATFNEINTTIEKADNIIIANEIINIDNKII